MRDRRSVQSPRSRFGKGILPDRRVRWMDRRLHRGASRFLFFPVADLWSLLVSGHRVVRN